MNFLDKNKLLFNVDEIKVHENIILGHGWVFSKLIEIDSVFITSKSFKQKFKTKYGIHREDVHLHYDQYENSKNCGFVFSLSLDRKIDVPFYINLEINFVNGDRKYIKKIQSKTFYKFFSYTNYLMRLLLRLRFKDTKDILIKFLKSVKISLSIRKLKTNFDSKFTLVIDHDLGGGANTYRKVIVADLIHTQNNVILLTYNLQDFCYQIEIFHQQYQGKESFLNLINLKVFLDKKEIDEIILNNLVSYPKLADLLKMVVSIKSKNKSHLYVQIHDFFSICPSYTLLNNDNQFCNIPSFTKCNKCLPANQSNTYPFLNPEIRISEWRSMWERLLLSATAISTFSDNSKKLVLRAYKNLNSSKIVTTPHALLTSIVSIKISNTKPKNLTIGILGNISLSKGSLVLEELVNIIKVKNFDIKIVIFGSVDRYLDPLIVHCTGEYRHDQLPRLFDKFKPTVFLFPSIWPETFSYVVQELMHYGFPIAAFDIGAPSERLIGYKNVKLIKYPSNSKNILNTLINFHKSIYSRKK
jgi:glycosyltransferase involved in cell wall biosynthesis